MILMGIVDQIFYVAEKFKNEIFSNFYKFFQFFEILKIFDKIQKLTKFISLSVSSALINQKFRI